jgi:large subunit ribosomal protein L13Ae
MCTIDLPFQPQDVTHLPQRLSHEVGWGYKDVVDRLEEKRRIKSQAFHERKVRITLQSDNTLVLKFPAVITQAAALKLRQKAIADVSSKYEQLAELGY